MVTQDIDIEENYQRVMEEYKAIFNGEPIEELWRPFDNEDKHIKINLFNLITWEATLHDFRERGMLKY